MKTFYALFVRALICFLPSLMVGQSVSNPNPQPDNGNSLQDLQMNSSPLTGTPLIRLINTGDTEMNGVKLELNDLDLMSPGPTIIFDCPDPLITGSGRFRFRPSLDNPEIWFDNSGPSGDDGARLRIVDVLIPSRSFEVNFDLDSASMSKGFGNNPDNICAITTFDPLTPKVNERFTGTAVDSFFDVFYDLSLGKKGTGFGNNPNNICAITTFDPVTPKVNERFTGTAVDNFFDVFYDLSLGKKGTGFGNNPDNLCLVSTFDPVHPSLLERLTSNLTDVPSFFDVFTDLEPLSHTHKVGLVGDPDFDLLRITSFEIDTPRIRERIETSSLDTSWADHFFDITYDLELATIGKGFGNNPDNICAITTFDPLTPKVNERYTGTGVDSFFDVFYDLSLGKKGTGFGNNPNNICAITTFDPMTPKITERYTGTAAVDTFFDVIYDLSLGKKSTGFGNNPNNICAISTFDPVTPSILERITGNTSDSFFDVFVDLSLGTETRRLGSTTMGSLEDLQVTRTYDKATPKLLEKISSGSHPDSFFDITYRIDEGSHGMKYKELELLETYVSEPTSAIYKEALLLGLQEKWFRQFDVLNGVQKTSFMDLHLVDSLIHGTGGRLVRRLESTHPALAGSSIEERVDIELAPLHLISTRMRFPEPLPPLEVRYEYDGLARKVREVTSDLGGTAQLVMERQFQVPPGMPPRLVIFGDLQVNGMFSSANKFFKIDHPLDPDNKYLIHSCIESPEMMNVYNGNATTDDKGFVTIKLPDYFETLNNDFRYQLTCMGQFAQAIVHQKIHDNQFVVRTDKPNVEVSWQVTGIRKDPGSGRETFATEVEKEPEMKGKRLYQ